MTWKRKRDRKGELVQWSESLGHGKVLNLRFSVNNWSPSRTVIMPHLIVHRPGLSWLAWHRAGRPTGLPGVTAWARVMELWDSGLDAALALTDNPYVEVQVEAETPRLMRIYRNRLERHGYVFQRGDDEAYDYLWFVLRG